MKNKRIVNNIRLLRDMERVNGSWNRRDTFEVELSVHVMVRSVDTGRRSGRRENFQNQNEHVVNDGSSELK